MSERRKFLQGLAAVSAGYVVNGDAWQVASNTRSVCVDSWPQFSKTNKEKYPCILVMEFSTLYHDQLLKLSKTKSRRLQATFSKVPGLVLSRPSITKHFKIKNLSSNIFLVSLDGKVLKQGKLDYSKLADSRTLNSSLEEFFYSDKVLAKLWQNFTKADKAAEIELAKQLEILDKGHYRQRSIARKAINKNLKNNLWTLAQYARTSGSIEQRESCRDLLISYKAKAPLLYGVPAQRSNNHRSGIACGMANMPQQSRQFINQVIISA
jgi:hypothetical protein